MSTERHVQLHAFAHDGILILRIQTAMIRQPKVAEELGRDILDELGTHQPSALLVDLAKVEYLSSTGFAMLLSVSKAVTEKKMPMALCGLQEDVARGSSILGIQRYVGVYLDEAEAIAALKQALANRHDKT